MANLTMYILAFLVLVFIIQIFSPAFENAFIFDPVNALSQPWRFVTSIFLHGGILHILFNGYALLIFGSILERKVTAKEYLIIFFGAGIIGSLTYYATYLLGVIPPIPALGASGAIYGILGAVAMLLPDMRIFVFFIPMPMKYAAVLWLVLTFLGAFDVSSGIADAAHFGGLIFGLAYGWYLARKPQSYAGDWGWQSAPLQH